MSRVIVAQVPEPGAQLAERRGSAPGICGAELPSPRLRRDLAKARESKWATPGATKQDAPPGNEVTNA